MNDIPEVKPVLIKVISVIYDPDRERVAFLYEDENHGQHKFSLTAVAAYQSLSAMLQKKVLRDRLHKIENYPIPLESIAHSKERSGQLCLQLFFPSGLPVTIEFPRGTDDIDKIISALTEIKAEMINNPATRH